MNKPLRILVVTSGKPASAVAARRLRFWEGLAEVENVELRCIEDAHRYGGRFYDGMWIDEAVDLRIEKYLASMIRRTNLEDTE
ncbi:MAG: hypothetical protein ACOVKC_03205 [Brevundimonas sp.]